MLPITKSGELKLAVRWLHYTDINLLNMAGQQCTGRLAARQRSSVPEKIPAGNIRQLISKRRKFNKNRANLPTALCTRPRPTNTATATAARALRQRESRDLCRWMQRAQHHHYTLYLAYVTVTLDVDAAGAARDVAIDQSGRRSGMKWTIPLA